MAKAVEEETQQGEQEEGVITESEQQQQQQPVVVPISPSDTLTMFFQVHTTLFVFTMMGLIGTHLLQCPCEKVWNFLASYEVGNCFFADVPLDSTCDEFCRPNLPKWQYLFSV